MKKQLDLAPRDAPVKAPSRKSRKATPETEEPTEIATIERLLKKMMVVSDFNVKKAQTFYDKFKTDFRPRLQELLNSLDKTEDKFLIEQLSPVVNDKYLYNRLGRYLPNRIPKNQAELDDLSLILFDVEEAMVLIDNYQTRMEFKKYIPMMYVIPPYDKTKANRLREYLDTLPETLKVSSKSNPELHEILEDGVDYGDTNPFANEMYGQRLVFEMRKNLFQLLENVKKNKSIKEPEREEFLMEIEEKLPIALLDDSRIQELTSIQTEDNEPFLTMDNSQLIYMAVSLILKLGFLEGKRYLQNQKTTNLNRLQFENPFMTTSRNIFYLRIQNQKSKGTDIVEGIFTCPKCHNKKIEYTEQQIRSADEPATIFLHCPECDTHWRRN